VWSCFLFLFSENAPLPKNASSKTEFVMHVGCTATEAIKRDPFDDKCYSFEQILEKYKGSYSKQDVELYWENTCEEVEVRIDPEDGKACTLDELQAKYKNKYSKKDIKMYFQSSCESAEQPSSKNFGCSEKKPKNSIGMKTSSWPEGYPLPLVPPASLCCIEDVANFSRKSQAQKAHRAAQVRQKLGNVSIQVSKDELLQGGVGSRPVTGKNELQQKGSHQKRWKQAQKA